MSSATMQAIASQMNGRPKKGKKGQKSQANGHADIHMNGHVAKASSPRSTNKPRKNRTTGLLNVIAR
jgi:hypothetical protein